MLDEVNKILYVDYSTLTTFQACKEKARLGYHEGYRISSAPLDFGHAIHAAIQGYFDALAGGWHDDKGKWHEFYDNDVHSMLQKDRDPRKEAHAAFYRDLKYTDAKLPLNIESEERRSVERGIALIDAYIYRWRGDLYENVLRTSGEPFTEVSIRFHIGRIMLKGVWYEIIYIGHIDRIMRSIRSGKNVIFETKTTTQGLSNYVRQVKPNHQITGYFAGAWAMGLDISECIWDCIFVSDRQPDLKKSLISRYWLYGVDVEKDFDRKSTGRVLADVDEWKRDILNAAVDYGNWLTSEEVRWPRTAPGACHQFGGCVYRDVCQINKPADRDQYLKSKFVVSKWEPWKELK